MGKDQRPFLPESRFWRIIYGYFTFVAPLACFILTGTGVVPVKPDWQSGAISDYARLMLMFPVARIFYPLLAISSLSMLMLLISPLKYCQYKAIRLGVYVGTILSIQYALLLGFSIMEIKEIASEATVYLTLAVSLLMILPLGIKKLYLWLVKVLPKNIVNTSLTAIAIVFWIIGVLRVGPMGSQEGILAANFYLILFLLFITLVLAPSICTSIFANTAYRLYHYKEAHLSDNRSIYQGLLLWLLGYSAGWVVAITRTMEEYAKLPKEAPTCYIATAAAHGHQNFVKSDPVQLANGQTLWLNDQLRYFKAGELMLLAIAPRLHTILRVIYDCLGRRLALLIKQPLIADVAYLLLKPVEWLIRLSLQLMPTVKAQLVNIYPGINGKQ